MIAAPASTQRFASAAISSGVMGTLGLVALVWFSLTATSMISFSVCPSFAGSWHRLATGLRAPYPHQGGRKEEPAPEQYTARAPALLCARPDKLDWAASRTGYFSVGLGAASSSS